MRYEFKTLTILASLVSLAALAPSSAWAQAASDVACKKCVDAKDLANKAVVGRAIKKGAVTGNRIAPGAVDAARLATSAVTESKLGAGAVGTAKLANGAAGPGTFASGAVGTAGLADGAVTGAKLTNGAVTTASLATAAVTATELGSAAVGGDKIADGALTLDKLAPGALDANVSFAQTVFVSPVGPAATDNCTELQNALSGITDNAATKPYVVKIEPGIYDCGTTSVAMKPFVDIEGSGEGVTTIRGITPDIVPVVRGAGNAELRFLTVEHSGGVSDARAIVSNDPDFGLRQVTAISQGGSMFAIAITVTGSARLIDVTATVLSSMAADRAIAVFVFDTTAELVNVTATASGPGTNDALNVSDAGGIATARGSVFVGANAVRGVTGAVGNFVASQLIGNQILATGATVACVNAYDASFVELSSTCL